MAKQTPKTGSEPKPKTTQTKKADAAEAPIANAEETKAPAKKAPAKKTVNAQAEVAPAPEIKAPAKKAPAKKAVEVKGTTPVRPVAAPGKKPVAKKVSTNKTKEAATPVEPVAAPAKKPTAKKVSVAEKATAPAKQPATSQPQMKPVEAYSRFTDYDIDLFRSGKHFKLYEKFGSHVVELNGVVGTYFAVWAPNAQYVSVIGDFNGWNRGAHNLYVRWDGSGIWEGYIPNVGNGHVYKYFIKSTSGEELEKSDPFALRWEEPPRTASIVADTYYEWNDGNWMANRHKNNSLKAPYSVYEVHLGSWARNLESPDDFYTYEQLADKLVPYVKDLGFTHVEFMPIMEHPYYPSWGYQVSGYFAASSRYGTPQQLMKLIERFHQEGIGVILDWVPSHFPGDIHALYRFDGTHLYEHADTRKGFHPDWKSFIFNYGRNEVRAFLISNALFWLDRYHADGLRVDAVASMLYLDYSRNHGEWEPNVFGGNENLEAISFLKEFNQTVYAHFPDVQTIAEESTSFTGVSRPLYNGGLGFGMKWMMGWMHDTLKYFSEDPIHRKYHHNKITFSMIYAFTENFMLPFSHDEVVYGKGSMLRKMPGDEWRQFANLRLMYGYMFSHPGTKLLFMGAEFGQGDEWNFQHSLQWHVLEYPNHIGIKETVKELNHLYRSEPALYERAFDASGFEWLDGGNANDSVLVYLRKGNNPADDIVVVLNMTPVIRHQRVGVPAAGTWQQILNTDEKKYWGSGVGNAHAIKSDNEKWHGKAQSIQITLPPLAALYFKRVG